MATIDSKVVEMRFDNKQFESGISQSMNSLNKLKATLKFDGVIDQAKLNSIAKGVDYLASRFSALGQILMSVKMQAAAMVKSLTVDQIGSGWAKYNQIIASTQTIMSATARSWTDNKALLKDQEAQMGYVTEQLNKLNAFTDETSAKLTDMVGNIGKFTSAGVKLDVATDAMMGIATWGYKSGASIDQMSRAMYNLSQAMGMGSLKVQDWASIENANMATEEFKRTAIETGVELGKLKKKSNGAVYAFDKFGKQVRVTTENFRSTLASGWLDSKVITATLKKYGDFSREILELSDNTGVSVTKLMRYIGDAKKGTLNLSDSTRIARLAYEEGVDDVESFQASLKKLSGTYYDLGYTAFRASQEAKTFQEAIDYTKDAVSTNWMNMFKAVVGNYLEAKELWTAVTEEMYDVFIEDLENQNEVLEGWAELGGREALLEGIANAWYIIKDTIFAIKDAFKSVFPPATSAKLKELTDNFVTFTYILGTTESKVNKIQGVFTSLFKGIKYIVNSIKNVFNTVVEALDFNELLPKDWLKDNSIYGGIKKVVEWFERLAYVYEITEKKAKPFFNTFSSIFSGIKSIIKTAVKSIQSVATAFLNIFPPQSSRIIESVAKIFENLTKAFEITDERADKLRRIFEGLFSVIDIVRIVVESIIAPFSDLTESSGSLLDIVLNIAVAFADWIKKIRDWLKENKTLETIMGNIVQFFKSLPQKIDDASVALTGMHIDEVIGNIKEAVKNAWEYIKGVFKAVKEDLSALFNKNKDLKDETEESGKSFTVFEKLREYLDKAKEGFELLKPYLDQIKQFFDDTVEFKFPTPEEMGDGMVKGGQFAALAMLASMFYEIASFFKTFKKEGKEISKSFANFINTVGDSIKNLADAKADNIRVKTFETIAKAVLELAAAIFILSLLPANKLAVAAITIAAMMGLLAKSFEYISKTSASKEQLSSITKTLGMMELLLATIAGSIYVIATQTDMASASVAAGIIAVLMGEVAFIVDKMQKTKFTPEQAKEIASIFNSISIMIAAIGVALMLATKNGDWKTIAVAGTVIGGMLFAIAGAMRIMPKSENLNQMAGALVAVSFAMLLIGVSIALISQSGDWESIGMAGLIMAAMVFAIAGALKLIDPKTAMASGGAMAVVAVGMLLLAAGLAMLAKLDLTSVGIALLALGGALGIVLLAGLGASYVAPGLYALGIAIALIGTGAALAGAGLWLVAQAIQTVTSISPEGIESLLDGLTNFFERLPDMATNAGQAVINFIQALVNGKSTIIAGVTLIFEAIITALRTIFPMVNELIKEVLIGGIETLREVFPVLNELIKEILLGGLETLKTLIPVVVDTIILLTKELLRSLRELIPDLTETLFFIIKDTLIQIRDNLEDIIALTVEIGFLTITGLIKGLAAAIPNLVNTGIEFVLAFINGIADGIEEHAEDMRAAMENLVDSLINTFCTLLGIHSPSTVFSGFGGNIIQGLIDGIGEMVGKAKEAITSLADKVLTKFCEMFGIEKPNSVGELKEKAVQIINGFISGIKSMIDDAKRKISEFADKVLTAVCEKFGVKKPTDAGELKQVAKQVIDGFIKGINEKISAAKEAIGKFCKSITDKVKNVFDIHSPSRVFMKFGEYIDEGLAIGIRNYAGVAEVATEKMGDKVIDNMSSVLSGITGMIDEGFDEPTIKPVLDLTDVTDGLGVMDDMLSSNRSIALSGYASQATNTISNQASLASMFEQLKASIGGAPAENQNGVVNNNTFNISGGDPREIADEVSRILQREVERRDSVWE